jgi:hypothetical protein
MSGLHSLRRALTAPRSHPRELGAPPTYTEHHCRHVERQLRRAELARARERAPRLLALAAGAGVAMGATTTVTIGFLSGAVVALGLLALAFLPGKQQRAPWQQWRQVRRQLLASLRELTPDWTVLWDRRLDSAPTPVTIATGPTGIWLLWIPEPEWAAHDPAPILRQLIQDIADAVSAPSFAAQAYAMYERAHITHVASLMIGGVPQAGPDQLYDWTERANANTIQEPILIPS